VDLDPALFLSGFQDNNQIDFFLSFICSLLFEGTFTSVFIDKNHCCGSVTFWYGTDPDPRIRTSD
jgi:hypothetical protein